MSDYSSPQQGHLQLDTASDMSSRARLIQRHSWASSSTQLAATDLQQQQPSQFSNEGVQPTSPFPKKRARQEPVGGRFAFQIDDEFEEFPMRTSRSASAGDILSAREEKVNFAQFLKTTNPPPSMDRTLSRWESRKSRKKMVLPTFRKRKQSLARSDMTTTPSPTSTNFVQRVTEGGVKYLEIKPTLDQSDADTIRETCSVLSHRLSVGLPGPDGDTLDSLIANFDNFSPWPQKTEPKRKSSKTLKAKVSYTLENTIRKNIAAPDVDGKGPTDSGFGLSMFDNIGRINSIPSTTQCSPRGSVSAVNLLATAGNTEPKSLSRDRFDRARRPSAETSSNCSTRSPSRSSLDSIEREFNDNTRKKIETRRDTKKAESAALQSDSVLNLDQVPSDFKTFTPSVRKTSTRSGSRPQTATQYREHREGRSIVLGAASPEDIPSPLSIRHRKISIDQMGRPRTADSGNAFREAQYTFSPSVPSPNSTPVQNTPNSPTPSHTPSASNHKRKQASVTPATYRLHPTPSPKLTLPPHFLQANNPTPNSEAPVGHFKQHLLDTSFPAPPQRPAPAVPERPFSQHRSSASSSNRSSVSSNALLKAQIKDLERQNRYLNAALMAVLTTNGQLNGCPCKTNGVQQQQPSHRPKTPSSHLSKDSSSSVHNRSPPGTLESVREQHRRGSQVSVDSAKAELDAFEVYCRTRKGSDSITVAPAVI